METTKLASERFCWGVGDSDEALAHVCRPASVFLKASCGIGGGIPSGSVGFSRGDTLSNRLQGFCLHQESVHKAHKIIRISSMHTAAQNYRPWGLPGFK